MTVTQHVKFPFHAAIWGCVVLKGQPERALEGTDTNEAPALVEYCRVNCSFAHRLTASQNLTCVLKTLTSPLVKFVCPVAASPTGYWFKSTPALWDESTLVLLVMMVIGAVALEVVVQQVGRVGILVRSKSSMVKQ